ncbi:MAG: alanine racemase [Bdellovibrionota bacterium]
MEGPHEPSWAQVDLAAIERNYRAMRGLLSSGTKVLAVVKADAYGHGAVPVARRLADAGAEWLGVAQVQEGIELRRGGLKSPILLLQGIRAKQAPEVLENDLTPLVFDREALEALSSFGKKRGKKAHVHVKVDTGMTRLGVRMDDLPGFLDAARKLEGIAVEGICSHFAIGEEPENPLTRKQRENFSRALEIAKEKGLPNLLRHLANSAATILDPSVHFDMVRLGISLYGAYPAGKGRERVQLSPALSWRTSLQQVKDVPAGTGVSYGATFRTPRDTRIGVLPVGYADGIPRRLSGKFEVLIHGKRCPAVGTVCMDFVMVDLGGVPSAKAGDEAVIIGTQQSGEITAQEFADAAGTIPYEVFCAIGRRVRRVYP